MISKTYEELLAEFHKDLEGVPSVDELDFGDVDYDPYSDPEFVRDICKASFVNDVLISMEKQGVSKTELAQKMGKHLTVISRVLNETSNFQINTLAEFACALNMSLSVRLYEHNQKPVFLNENEQIIKTTRSVFIAPEEDKDAPVIIQPESVCGGINNIHKMSDYQNVAA